MLSLFSFFNSSASFRVRIALALKGLESDYHSVNIRLGQQNEAPHAHLSASYLVPVLLADGQPITQSLAIIDYLDELKPDPRLIPFETPARTRVLEISQLVACDIHPLNNLRVLNYLTQTLGVSNQQRLQWYLHWITLGFDALEALIPDTGLYCVGTAPSLADCCLVPQVANAQRMGANTSSWPRIGRIYTHCMTLAPFIAAAPAQQPDFVPA